MSLALALVMCLSLAILVAASDTEYDSSGYPFAAGGNSYNCWSALYVPSFRASAWLEKTNSTAFLPANSLGAEGRLYEGSTLKVSTGMIYNSGSDYFMWATTSSYGGSGTYYSQGKVNVQHQK